MIVPIVKSRSFSNVSPASDVELGEGYRHESRSGEQAIPDHGQSVLRRHPLLFLTLGIFDASGWV